jgi:ABC-2 type transport system permease protein
MISTMRLILTFTTKDFQVFWSDRRAAALGFLVPIILASTFGLVFRATPKAGDAPKLPLMIVVEEPHPFTQQVVDILLTGDRVTAEVVSLEEARKRIADRRPSVAVIFPKGFETLSEWQPGQKVPSVPVQIEHNPLATSEGQWAEGVVSEATMRLLAKERLIPWMGALAGQEDAMQLPFTVKTSPLVEAGHNGFNSYSHSFCGMTLQYLLFWGMESGLLLLRERRQSLWLRMRAAPVPLWVVLMGKALSTAAIAMLQVLCTFAFGYFVFGVVITGSFFGFLLLTFGAALLASATGLLVAAIGGTEARARSVCILVILGVSMLGGLWLPSFVLPGWARDLALSLPTTWAMRGLDAVTWQGQSFSAIVPNASVVVGFTAVFLAIAVARLIHSEARRKRGGL